MKGSERIKKCALLAALCLIFCIVPSSCARDAAQDAAPSADTPTAQDAAPSADTPTAHTVQTGQVVLSDASGSKTEPSEASGPAQPTDFDDPSTDSGSSSPASESPRLSCRTEGDGGVVACWWWDGRKATAKRPREKYLDFLAENDVNRVYLCLPDFKPEQLAAFVRSARERGISVCLLTGDIAFFDPSSDMAARVIDAYLDYQKNAAPGEKLDGIHFDVEPHQRADFAQNREKILDLYAAFVVDAARKLRASDERVEWDIPFWFDGFTVNAPDGSKRPLLDLLAENADALTLMSYRNTASAILTLSKEEIAVCRKYRIGVICGADAYSTEGADVSFADKGKSGMYDALTQVYNELKAETDGLPFGVAIHYLDTWYDLKD